MKPTALYDHLRSPTHLFMVRVWVEDLGDGKSEWHGKAQHILSGEVCYFRDWQMLQEFIQANSSLSTANSLPSD